MTDLPKDSEPQNLHELSCQPVSCRQPECEGLQTGDTMNAIKKILVIDDETEVGELAGAAAVAMGYQCTATTDAEIFLDELTPDTSLVLLDLIMPDMDGMTLLRLLGARKCQAGIVLMSGIGKRTSESAEQLAEALGLCVVGNLHKPFRPIELRQMLARTASPAAPPHATQISQNEELRSALERNEFVLYYQPQIEIATGRVAGVEALVRWQHPERGLIFPDDFIGRMEKLGIIDELGWVVVNRGMREVGQFANGDGKALMLSVNESVHSLNDLEFPDLFVSLAEKHGISAGNVTIEITETDLIEELSKTLDILTRLRMKQVKLSIDDFGTGYAMIQQLKNIPATELKIDKCYVQGTSDNERDRTMVQKTIGIGHELGMKVVGEGVETEEQMDFLRSSGCDIAQGYKFSRPLPATEMMGWLESYRSRLVHAD